LLVKRKSTSIAWHVSALSFLFTKLRVLGSRIFAHVGVCHELLLVKTEFLFQEKVRRERWRQPRDWR
jgi:hypothetical protein